MKARLEVTIGGRTHTIEMRDGETVLEAALREGIDAPYSCQAGVCTACQAKVLQGRVEMETCDVLTEEEVEAGEILTCQARALTDVVKVKYP